jgi:hypothetical protein
LQSVEEWLRGLAAPADADCLMGDIGDSQGYREMWLKHCRLETSAARKAFVRVETLCRLSSEVCRNRRSHSWDARCAAVHFNGKHVRRTHSGITQRRRNRTAKSRKQTPNL